MSDYIHHSLNQSTLDPTYTTNKTETNTAKSINCLAKTTAVTECMEITKTHHKLYLKKLLQDASFPTKVCPEVFLQRILLQQPSHLHCQNNICILFITARHYSYSQHSPVLLPLPRRLCYYQHLFVC